MGNNYYRARYYNPNIGRFVSEDPAGYSAWYNFYAYVANTPILLRDPFGLEAQTDMPGERPSGRCCNRDEILNRIGRVIQIKNDIDNGRTTGGDYGASTFSPGSPPDPNGWVTPTPLPVKFFNPKHCEISFKDRCLQYCCKRHEWIHFRDNRPYNIYWDQPTLTKFSEIPAYEEELRCLETFL